MLRWWGFISFDSNIKCMLFYFWILRISCKWHCIRWKIRQCRWHIQLYSIKEIKIYCLFIRFFVYISEYILYFKYQYALSFSLFILCTCIVFYIAMSINYDVIWINTLSKVFRTLYRKRFNPWQIYGRQ